MDRTRGQGWGPHVVLWLLAIPLFYLPLAGTVVYLSRRMPLEGGVYQWVKIGISPFAGFQAAWNYAFFPIFYYANSGSVVANSVAYLLGPRYDWMNNNKLLLIAINMAFFAIVLAINIRGLHLARWITGAGGALIIGLYLLVVALFAWRAIRGLPVARPVLTFTWPAITLFTVNLFSKMAFNALSGFEQAAIFAGEYHTPERNIARSVWIAARPHRSDRACFANTGRGAAFLGAGGSAGRRAILALLFAYFTQTVACVAQVSRLPMVTGWDGLLPARFSALHPRFRTPVRSIAAVVAICAVLGAASLFQVGEQEANQILMAAGFACSGLYYLAMFAVVLRGKAPAWLRVSACAAAGVTVVAVGFDVVPILDVARPVLFGAKVAGAVVAVNAIDIYDYSGSVGGLYYSSFAADFYVPTIAPGRDGVPPCALSNSAQVCDNAETIFANTARNLYSVKSGVATVKSIASQTTFGVIQNTIGSTRFMQMSLSLIF